MAAEVLGITTGTAGKAARTNKIGANYFDPPSQNSLPKPEADCITSTRDITPFLDQPYVLFDRPPER